MSAEIIMLHLTKLDQLMFDLKELRLNYERIIHLREIKCNIFKRTFYTNPTSVFPTKSILLSSKSGGKFM